MDGQTLQNLFSGTNPFLAQMGEKAFNLDQQKRQADLASIMGQEDRARQMLPAELAGKGAVTRLNNSTAAMNEDVLSRKIPVEDERKAALQASFAKMDDTARAQMKAKVLHSMQLAAAMKKGGGQLPPGFSLSPEEMQIYTPQNLDKIIAHGQAFMEMDPEWLAARKKAQEAQALENTRASNRVELKTTPAGKTSTMAPPKMSLDQQMNYYNSLALNEKDEDKKKLYQAEADRIELMIYRKASAGRDASRVGDPDLSNPKFNIPTVPPIDWKPTPRDGGGLPSGVTKSGW